MEGSTRAILRADHRERDYDWPLTTNVMAQKTITTTLPCVDAKVTTNENVVKQGKKYIGMFRVLNEDQVSFVEEPKVHTIHPELHWRLLNRTLHGRMSVNANHIKVEFYIRHGEYTSEQQVADMLASEIETMGDALCDTDLEEEVAKCC